ncbi:MAG: nitrate reductase associated protein [Candidatus Binataceae bacterium]
MFRRFSFEQDIYCTLECVPMTMRRKLDRIGLKIGLVQWQALGQGERLAMCHLPVEEPEECDALRSFVIEAVKRVSGAEPKELPPDQRLTAEPPREVPSSLVADARAAGVALTQQMWERLDGDQRYVLTKLGGPAKSDKLAIALRELFAEPPGASPGN